MDKATTDTWYTRASFACPVGVVLAYAKKTTCSTRLTKKMARVEAFTMRLQQYCYPILSSSRPPSNFLPSCRCKGTEKRATKNVQLRVLPPTFKPVNNLICCKTGLMGVVKRATSLFNSFCSNVARQVVRFLLPVFPYLKMAKWRRNLKWSGSGRSDGPPQAFQTGENMPSQFLQGDWSLWSVVGWKYSICFTISKNERKGNA